MAYIPNSTQNVLDVFQTERKALILPYESSSQFLFFFLVTELHMRKLAVLPHCRCKESHNKGHPPALFSLSLQMQLFLASLSRQCALNRLCSSQHVKWVTKAQTEPEHELSNIAGARDASILLFDEIHEEAKGTKHDDKQHGSRWTYQFWLSISPSGAQIHVRAPELEAPAWRVHRGMGRKRARQVPNRTTNCATGSLRALTKSPSQLCPCKLLISNPDNYLRLRS